MSSVRNSPGFRRRSTSFRKILVINSHLNMSSSILKVAFLPYYPMTNSKCPSLATFRTSARCQKLDLSIVSSLEPPYFRPGLFTEIIKLIADQANMTIEPVFFDLDTSTMWDQTVGFLLNGSLDTWSSTVEDTLFRRNHFVLSSALYKIRY